MQKNLIAGITAAVLIAVSATTVSAVLNQDGSMMPDKAYGTVNTMMKTNNRIVPMPPVNNPFSQTDSTTQLSEEARLKLREQRLNKDNLVEFRKKQQEEYQQKAKEISSQRVACGKQISEKTKARALEAKEMMKSCLTNAKAGGDKSPSTTCGKQMATFAKETKTQLLDIKEGCFNSEQQVLGISTTVPAQY